MIAMERVRTGTGSPPEARGRRRGPHRDLPAWRDRPRPGRLPPRSAVRRRLIDVKAALTRPRHRRSGSLAGADHVGLRERASRVRPLLLRGRAPRAMAAAVREVPFAGSDDPARSPPSTSIIRKAMLDRPKDWLDIEAILVATDRSTSPRSKAGRLAGRRPRVTKLSAAASPVRSTQRVCISAPASALEPVIGGSDARRRYSGRAELSATIVIESLRTRPAGIEGSAARSCWSGPRFSSPVTSQRIWRASARAR